MYNNNIFIMLVVF